MQPKYNLLPSDGVEPLQESIPDDKTRRAKKEMMQMMMANQEQANESNMELSDFCEELDQRLQEQELYSLRDSIIIKNLPYDTKDGELIKNTLNFFKA